jgi:transposase
MIHNSTKIIFKDYNPNQVLLLPASLEEKIQLNHPVRIVSQVVDHLDLTSLYSSYKGGGAPSYYPRMMLKLWIYAYLRNIYSSRKLEQAIKENIHFMWLSAEQEPDHNTLNRFRSGRLKESLKKIFSQVVTFLEEEGYVSLKEIYVDGTKIEAQANKYTFVWGRSIQTHKNRISKQLKELWAYAESVAKEEMENNLPEDFKEIDPEKVSEIISKIDHALKGKQTEKKQRQKLNYAKRSWPGKLKEYQRQEKVLGKRKSYSKTDQDATFMRMKEDHMGNGQLKPAYNLQISTHDQFVLNYGLYQSTTDTVVLKPHLAEFNNQYHHLPQTVTADAGYGSEENYEYLENNNIEPYVKYNYFHLEQTKKYKEDPFRTENLYYNDKEDCYYCPMGQKMNYIGKKKRETANGYKQTYSLYQAQNCRRCPLRGSCHKGKQNRIIEINHKLLAYKKKARENLLSEQGIRHRSKRPADVEATFGMIKQNMKFKRFHLRGLQKVETEIGLLSIALNLMKISV